MRVCVCEREEEWKKFPSTALPEFLPPDENRESVRERIRGKKEAQYSNVQRSVETQPSSVQTTPE